MYVSVVILNYNGSKFLKSLFETLSNQTFKDFEVIFVDNASTDNSLQLLNNQLANEHTKNLRIKVVENGKNVGYCRGNNIGMKCSKGEYVVFLNNDTYVSRSWLEELVRVMEDHPTMGACQSRLIDMQTGKVQMDGRRIDLYGWSQTLVFNRSDLLFSAAPFYASGASVIVRRATLLRIGGFDAELFSGDHDLCWRLRLLGYGVGVALQSICYHYGSASTKMLISSVKSLYDHDREVLRILLKNYSMRNSITRIILSGAIMFIEAAYLCFEDKIPLYSVSFFQAIAWNLRKFRDTLATRYRIQSSRCVDDCEIEKRMLHHSILLMNRWTAGIG